MNLSRPLLAGFLLLLFYAPHIRAQAASVYWDNVDQVIDGFGASTAQVGLPLTSAQATLFFSASSGIGLSLLRTEVPSDGSCATVNATCAGQVMDMQLAIANGATVWSTPWSPPAAMKSNGSVDNGGSLLAASYGAYATYLSNYIKSLNKLYGINLYALSVQNEPDDSQPYESALWTAQNLHDFILNNLGPTLAANGQSSVRIMLPESTWNSFTADSSTTMNDPKAAAYVGINAWHDYDDAASISNPFASSGKGFWETEVSAGKWFGPSLCGGCWDPSIADALLWAQILDNRMAVSNANAWNWWAVYCGLNNNEGLIGPDDMTVSKRAYMMGNYSKFVRPGFYRIDATHTPQSGVLVSAYKNSSTGSLVIVAINQNSSNVSQTFTLNGATTSSLTPWITSGSLNLIRQLDTSVSGESFTYSLPGYSITSFVGTITSASSQPAAPAPPTLLTATVSR